MSVSNNWSEQSSSEEHCSRTVVWLRAQAEGRHYSTFSLYPPDVWSTSSAAATTKPADAPRLRVNTW